MARTPAQALDGLLDKAPPGWVYPRRPGSLWGKTFAPLAAEASLFEVAAEAQLVEVDPGAASPLLPDYERVLGPDPCMAPAPTFGARQHAARLRWTARGGASRAYFIGLAAQLGIAVTIQEFAPSRFGRPFGQPFGGEAWAHAWQMTAPAFTRTFLPFGGRFGDPFASWGGGALECNVRRRAPAHTVVRFSYVGPAAAGTWDGGTGWDRGGWAP